jgi:hypothetical protein
MLGSRRGTPPPWRFSKDPRKTNREEREEIEVRIKFSMVGSSLLEGADLYARMMPTSRSLVSSALP